VGAFNWLPVVLFAITITVDLGNVFQIKYWQNAIAQTHKTIHEGDIEFMYQLLFWILVLFELMPPHGAFFIVTCVGKRDYMTPVLQQIICSFVLALHPTNLMSRIGVF